MATTIYIPEDYSSIQEGLNSAQFGDTVFVESGTYYENIIWPEVNGIKLIGENRDSTFIDGSAEAGVLRFESDDIVDTSTIVRNFTITNGFAQPPWPASIGGGIAVFNASPILENLNIVNNIADDFGGGMVVWGSNSICQIRNTVIANNSAIENGGVYCRGGSPVFDHVTVVENAPGGFYFNTRGYARIENSIVAFNDDFGIRVEGTSFENTTIALWYNDVYNSIQLLGFNAEIEYLGIVQETDPLFVDLENEDYHLTAESPCIDAGDPDFPYDPDGTITDLGAFTFNQQTDIDDANSLPENVGLIQNFPNPFNS